MSELKPCPFCGGTDIDSSFMRGYAKGDRTQPIIAAGCNDCGAMGPDVRVPDHSTGYDAAAEKWNARALMGWGEPVAWQFYDPGTGRWHDFMNEQHRRNTADAGYEIRALYTQAPAVDDAVILDCYDAGYLNDHGGGNVGWWQDYIRAELARAHDFYQSQVDTAIKGEG